MKIFKIIFLQLLHFLFPGNCALCGGSLIYPAEIQYSLCEKCRFSIILNRENKCSMCGKPLVSEIETCLKCRNGTEKNSFLKLWLLFPYTGKYRKLLTEYKFKKNLFLADFFAEKILELFAKEGELKDITIVPVPPRPGKIKELGWDQVEYLLKRLKKKNRALCICRCLKRKRSKVQKELNRLERLENLKGRIYLHKTPPNIVLVIDDVFTTGSTMEVCSQALKQGGAEKVYGLCLFYD